MSKRAKQLQEAEAEAEAKLTRREEKQDVVLVGNLIGEGHVNYVLMYNMLTGIRIGVCYLLLSFHHILSNHIKGLPMSSKNQTTLDSRRLYSPTQVLL